jgi:hypothetical protein
VLTSSSPKTGVRWSGLTINNQNPLTPSVLESCVIEFAGASSASAVKLNNASIEIVNCLVSDNAGVGIELTNSSHAMISESSVVMNVGDGIRANTSSNPVINFNSIFANGQNGVNKQDCLVGGGLIDSEYKVTLMGPRI